MANTVEAALKDHAELQAKHDSLVATNMAQEHQLGLVVQERDSLKASLAEVGRERDFYMRFCTEIVVNLENVKETIHRLSERAEQAATRDAATRDTHRNAQEVQEAPGQRQLPGDDSAARLEVVRQGPAGVGADTDITRVR